MATKPATKTPLKPIPSTPEDAAVPEKKKKMKLMLILPIVLVLLGGAGGGAWYFMHHGKEGEQAEKAKEPVPVKPPVFVTLEPFTVNLQGGEHFLQIGLVLQVANDETSEEIKTYLPQIRNRLLLLLSSKTPEQLESIEAKRKLAEDVLVETKAPLGPKISEGVQSVLFASMVVQ